MTDEGVALIGKCGVLQTLHLCDLPKLTHRSVSTVVERCMLLRRLDLTDCTYSTGITGTWRHLPTRLFQPAIIANALPIGTNVSAMAFEALRDAAHLTTLILSGCKRVRTHSYFGNSLEVLDLSRVPSVSNEALYAVAHSSRRLRAIRLSECGAVTEVGVTAMLRGCRHVEEIELGGCDITAEAVNSLAEDHRYLMAVVDDPPVFFGLR